MLGVFEDTGTAEAEGVVGGQQKMVSRKSVSAGLEVLSPH